MVFLSFRFYALVVLQSPHQKALSFSSVPIMSATIQAVGHHVCTKQNHILPKCHKPSPKHPHASQLAIHPDPLNV